MRLPGDLWYPVIRSRDLGRAPHGFALFDKRWVLWRDQRDRIAALEDFCPHRGAPLSQGQVVGDHVRCPYHGWEFDARGACRRIPGLDGAAGAPHVGTLSALEREGVIFVALDAEAAEPPCPRLPAGWNRTLWVRKAKAYVPAILENFLDPYHTHFVHRGLVRTDGERLKVKIKLHATAERIDVHYTEEPGQAGWMSRLFEKRRTESYARLLAPHFAQMEFFDAQGSRFRMSLMLTPVGERDCLAFFFVDTRPVRVPYFVLKALFAPMLERAIRQDRRILEAQTWATAAHGEFRPGFGPTDMFGDSIYAWWEGRAPTPSTWEREILI